MTKTLYDLEKELGIKNNTLLQWVRLCKIPTIRNKKKLTFTLEATQIFYRIIELKNDYKFDEIKTIIQKEFSEIIKTEKSENIEKQELKTENSITKEHIELIIKNEVSNIENKLSNNLQDVFKTEFQTLIELSSQISHVSQETGYLKAENRIIKDLSEKKDFQIEDLKTEKEKIETENRELKDQLLKSKSEIELLKSEIERQKTEIEKLSKLKFWNRKLF